MEGNENLQHVTPFMGQYSTARSSMVLKNYYVMPNGHSTRSALLTGKHPAMLGKVYIVTWHLLLVGICLWALDLLIAGVGMA